MENLQFTMETYQQIFEENLKQTVLNRIDYYCEAWKNNLISMVETVKENDFYFVAVKVLPVENNGYNVQRYILLTVKFGTDKPIFEDSNVIDGHYTKTAADTKKLTLAYFRHITNELEKTN